MGARCKIRDVRETGSENYLCTHEGNRQILFSGALCFQNRVLGACVLPHGGRGLALVWVEARGFFTTWLLLKRHRHLFRRWVPGVRNPLDFSECCGRCLPLPPVPGPLESSVPCLLCNRITQPQGMLCCPGSWLLEGGFPALLMAGCFQAPSGAVC